MHDRADQFAYEAWREDEAGPAVEVLDDLDAGFLQQLRQGYEQACRLGLRESFRQLLQRPDVRGLVHSGVVSATSAARIEVSIRAGDHYAELLAALGAGDRDGFLALCAVHGGSR